ncbi:MAG: ATP-binding protein [bacterium]|nr:ATP-binding protein [bacterium]
MIIGLRQTGKTTLAKEICSRFSYQQFNFDLASDRAEFFEQTRHSLSAFAERYRGQLLFIDEVQKLPESTSIIKHLHDQYGFRFLLTGSSALKLRRAAGDTLAGRVRIWHLYPLSFTELLIQRDELAMGAPVPPERGRALLEQALVYGALPRLINLPPAEQAPYLRDFMDTILVQDALEISALRKSTKLVALARYLALQIGQLVNVNELAQLTELSRASVYHYMEVLEQLSLIVRLRPISVSGRTAISVKEKVYFTDLGLRNALVNNFEPLNVRLDRGQLLENAACLGLKRQLDYNRATYELGFFRSPAGSEIDLVLKQGKREELFEVKTRRTWRPPVGVTAITPDNAWEYLR